MYKISIVGAGYVGLSNAILMARNNHVVILDIDEQKVSLINNKTSPIEDKDIAFYLKNGNIDLIATSNEEYAYKDANYIIIAIPTNYDPYNNYFDTSSIEKVVQGILNVNLEATIIIKSTVPVGFTENLKLKLEVNNIIFSPEFLREGKALYDNLYPSRIIIGDKSKKSKIFVQLLLKSVIKKDVQVLYTTNDEAEAIKLFANTYLAMRVAYFNEIDTYALTHNLDVKKIVEGICLDPRIGNYYNNPSFGYGGYCLSKDSKQLLADYQNIPQNLISAIVAANSTRKKFIAMDILKNKPKIIGIYRLISKIGTDNFRESAVQDIINILKMENVHLLIYEPILKEETFLGVSVITNLEVFKDKSDIIVANRLSNDLHNVLEKVYTRDIFNTG